MSSDAADAYLGRVLTFMIKTDLATCQGFKSRKRRWWLWRWQWSRGEGEPKQRHPNIYPDRNQFTYRWTEPSGQVSPGDKH